MSSVTTQSHIGGCSAQALRRQFGTPLLVIDEGRFRQNIRLFRKAFTRPGWRAAVTYAGKALLLGAIARIVAEEDLDIDVCSGGELETVLRAGVPAGRCIVHGCYKTDAELDLAVQHRVGHVVIDHFAEIDALAGRAGRAGFKCGVLLRVNPDVAAGAHKFVQTGGTDSKFGFPIADGQASQAVRAVLARPQLELRGIHCHIGSQVKDLTPYRLEIEKLLDFARHVLAGCSTRLQLIDIGGGLGVAEPSDVDAATPENWAGVIFDAFERGHPDTEAPRPTILVEPGRALIASAGTTLYTIGVRKRLSNGGDALIVDGGMSDNPRPALYEANYDVRLIDPSQTEDERSYTVFGRHCEADRLFAGVRLAGPAAGGILAVRGTGAYTYSMASNYNRFPRPAVVLAAHGEARLIARREALDQVLQLDVQDGPAIPLA